MVLGGLTAPGPVGPSYAATAATVGRPHVAPVATPATAVRTGAARATRVAWVQGLRRSKVVTARLDGSDRVVLHSTPRGGYTNLALSPDRQRIAFNPGAGPVRLLVSRTDRRGTVDVLPGKHPLEAIGTIGWSRDGRWIYLEGFVDEPSKGMFYPSYLFRVRSTGGRLQRGRRVGDGRDNGAVFGTIADSPRGIVFPGEGRVLLLPTFGPRRAAVTLARKAYHGRAATDGRTVLYRRVTANGTFLLRRVRVSDGRSTTLHRTRDYADDWIEFAPGPDGRVLAVRSVAPDDGAQTLVLDPRTGRTRDVPFLRSYTVAW